MQQMLLTETNRLQHTRHAGIVRGLKRHIASLRLMRAALEAEIAAQLKANPRLAHKADLMRSLIGSGPVAVATLLADMPELGTLTKGQAAHLAGLAPIARDSGTANAPRHIAAGRARVRKVLSMGALVAIPYNPVMARFAATLRQRGKPAKVVSTAVMRKLIVTLNAILRSDEPWRHAQPA